MLGDTIIVSVLQRKDGMYYWSFSIVSGDTDKCSVHKECWPISVSLRKLLSQFCHEESKIIFHFGREDEEKRVYELDARTLLSGYALPCK